MAQSAPDESFDEVEAELRLHPDVEDCAVTWVQTPGGRRGPVAYVVTRRKVPPRELRAFLSAPRTGARRTPQAFVPVPSLPRDQNGALDLKELPQPVTQERRSRAKGGSSTVTAYPREYWVKAPAPFTAAMAFTALPVAVAAFLLTDTLWPRSTDLSGVPQPWASLFFVLYLCECLSFGLGVGFLLFGWRPLRAHGLSPVLTAAVYLAIAWLLVAWWPQDNLYRLASKTDWPRQAALVYAFNISLMVAALVVAVFAGSRSGDRDR